MVESARVREGAHRLHKDSIGLQILRRSFSLAIKGGRIANLVRAGIPQTVAMSLTGHKTDSVFRRYDIVSSIDLKDAASRLDEVAVLQRASR
ncbi:MAG: hypothetical protein ACRD2I_10505 [Vicinamibacterales bacterium]